MALQSFQIKTMAQRAATPRAAMQNEMAPLAATLRYARGELLKNP
jgi:hypothetical protein